MKTIFLLFDAVGRNLFMGVMALSVVASKWHKPPRFWDYLTAYFSAYSFGFFSYLVYVGRDLVRGAQIPVISAVAIGVVNLLLGMPIWVPMGLLAWLMVTLL